MSNQPVFPGNPDTRFMNPKESSIQRFDYDHLCSKCNQTFRTKDELRNHQSHHRQEFYTCFICLRKFRSHRGIQNHMPVHKGKRYHCRKCSASFELKSSLDNHQAVHMPYIAKCPRDDCDKQFKSRGQLSRTC